MYARKPLTLTCCASYTLKIYRKVGAPKVQSSEDPFPQKPFETLDLMH